MTTFKVNGKVYFDVKTFAALTNRTTQAVYRLISKGNSVRKLKADHVLGKPMIPVSELAEFPFCSSGPWAKKNVYHFDVSGIKIEDFVELKMEAENGQAES